MPTLTRIQEAANALLDLRTVFCFRDVAPAVRVITKPNPTNRGWKRVDVARKTGVTKGKVDTYYYNKAGNRFRSLAAAEKAGYRARHT
jgi:hypothetical protein